MLYDPVCPVCAATDWQELGTRTYRRPGDDVPAALRSRLAVLFQVWLPNPETATLASILCMRCGFVCYRPRPEEADIDRKYEFLASHPDTRKDISRQLDSDTERAADVHAHLKPYLRSESTILDFGGGNGRLMTSLMNSGYDCSLIDFPGEKVPGIKHLGSQLTDIEPGRRFDVIVASHVLEHLADPYRVVSALREFLNESGVLYAEVPLEIWKAPPLPAEPVTHINYFTTDSLRRLLMRAGYRVIRCDEGTYVTEDGGLGLAIRAYARAATDDMREFIDYSGCAASTLKLVRPNVVTRVVRAVRHPRNTYQGLRQLLHERFGRTPVVWRLVRLLPRRLIHSRRR